MVKEVVFQRTAGNVPSVAGVNTCATELSKRLTSVGIVRDSTYRTCEAQPRRSLIRPVS